MAKRSATPGETPQASSVAVEIPKINETLDLKLLAQGLKSSPRLGVRASAAEAQGTGPRVWVQESRGGRSGCQVSGCTGPWAHLPFGRCDGSPAGVNVLIDARQEVLGDAESILK